MGFCEASEERNTHDNCVARLGHPLAQALHDWKQESFPPRLPPDRGHWRQWLYGVYWDIGVNGVIGGHWVQYGHLGQ